MYLHDNTSIIYIHMYCNDRVWWGGVRWSPSPLIIGCGCVASLFGEWVATSSTSVITVYYSVLYNIIGCYKVFHCIILYYAVSCYTI